MQYTAFGITEDQIINEDYEKGVKNEPRTGRAYDLTYRKRRETTPRMVSTNEEKYRKWIRVSEDNENEKGDNFR